MALSLRAAARSAGCLSCQSRVLERLLSTQNPKTAISPSRYQLAIRSSGRPAAVQRRWQSTILTEEDRSQQEVAPKEHSEVLNDVESQNEQDLVRVRPADVESGANDEPWYLQTGTIDQTPSELLERQRLPDIPVDSPAMLQALLEQMSGDLGLDYLSLLDMREMDPPPALGANLIMVVGTARSEKHLHVSADRLCRWLRSNYKLRPTADGLLGRQELKTKLRRKARRAKLMGSVADGDEDDGIRTGWVCVKIGSTSKSQVESLSKDSPGIVGFGQRSNLVNIVVQMMTQEKREEMDLERLWSGILRRNIESRSVESSVAEDEHAALQETTSDEASDTIYHPLQPALSRRTPDFARTTVRTIHTSRRLCRQEIDATLESPASTKSILSLADLWDRVQSAIAANHHDYDLLSDVQLIPSSLQPEWRLFILDNCIEFLQKNGQEGARRYLDQGKSTASPPRSTLVTIFNQAMSLIPTELEWRAKIWLLCFGKQIGHPDYTTKDIMEALDEIQLAGHSLPQDFCNIILRTVLTPAATQSEREVEEEARLSIEAATDVVQIMHAQGAKLLVEETFVVLQECLEQHHRPSTSLDEAVVSADSFELPSIALSPAQRRVHILMSLVDLPRLSDTSMMRLLDLYARGNHWAAFWDLWRWPMRKLTTHSADMYAYMFRKVAQTNHVAACMLALQTWVPDMERSDPVVDLRGDVSEAITLCLLVIDPALAQQSTQRNPKLRGNPWLDLWLKCHRND